MRYKNEVQISLDKALEILKSIRYGMSQKSISAAQVDDMLKQIGFYLTQSKEKVELEYDELMR